MKQQSCRASSCPKWGSNCLRRVEDHGAIMSLFEEPTNPRLADELSGPTLRKELAGVQQQHSHMAVCEVCTADCPPGSVLSPPSPDMTGPQGSSDLPVSKRLSCVLRAAQWWLVSSASPVSWDPNCCGTLTSQTLMFGRNRQTRTKQPSGT